MADAWDAFPDAAATNTAEPADAWDAFPDAHPAPVVAPAPPAHDPWSKFPDAPTGIAHDGDTFALTSGKNARLSGADAFELDQNGVALDGSPVPLGQQARSDLLRRLSPSDSVTDTGAASYGRPVVVLHDGSGDAGKALIADGMAVPTPEYLRGDPERLAAYMAAQRGAIAQEAGAYAGQYQQPADYRHEGGDVAPMRGKIAMTPPQSAEYRALVSNPKTTVDDLNGWFAAQGHAVTNAGNILDFMRRNPRAEVSTYFQQQDALDQPVLRAGPGVATRTLASFNEGLIPDTLGFPVDMANAALGAVGVPVSDTPFLGSESIREGMHDLGAGLTDDSFAPRSTAERYLQSVARGVGQAALPIGGLLGSGARMLSRAAVTARESGLLGSGFRSLATEAARSPGPALTAELAAGAGAGVGGQAARDEFPGNPWADMAGQLIGGGVGGMGAARAHPAAGTHIATPEGRWLASEGLPAAPPRAATEAMDAPASADKIHPVTEDQAGKFPDFKAATATASSAPSEQSAADRSPGDLWQASPAELERMLAEKGLGDRDKLVQALGEDGAKEFQRLDRAQNSQDTKRADAAAKEFDAKFGNLTPDQERLVYGVGETDAQADDISEVLNAHRDLAMVGGDDDQGWLGYVAGLGARKARVEDLGAVTRGEGSPTAQAAFVRLRGAYQQLARDGVPASDIPRRMADALVSRAGWKPEQADEIIGGFARDMAAQAAPSRPALSSTAAMHHEPETPAISGPTDFRTPASPETIAAADASRPSGSGPFGPIHSDLAGNYPAAVHRLSTDQAGEVPGVLSHPAIGPIDLPWGEAGNGRSDGYGLAKIAAHHPEVLNDLPDIVRNMNVESVTPNRIRLGSADHEGAVRLDFDGERKAWLLTAYEKRGSAPALADDGRVSAGDRDGSPGLGATEDIGPSASSLNGPADEPGLAPRARPMTDRRSPEELAALARSVDPGDVLPLPANTIGSLDEAVRANPGFKEVQAPDERAALPPYKHQGRIRRNPMDLISWLRTKGGLREDRGELAHMGLSNKARPIEFARDEGFLGKLIDNDRGMHLDDAARAAWDAGFFPDHSERPTVSDFLEALRRTNDGRAGRMFHPDDYDTVEAYHSIKAQRHAVEAARQAGSPLVEDHGESVTPDDLDANQPPATAYEDLPSVGGKVGNIDVSKLDSRGDILRAMLHANDKAGGFDAARRGRISHAETQALASDLNMTAADLLKRRQGQALNAEQALAARSILAKSADELVVLAKKAKGGSDADLVAFRKAWVRHVAIQEHVAGFTAEAGRTLSQFRAMASSKLPVGRIHNLQIDGAGGRKELEDAADMIINAGDKKPGDLNQLTRLALKPKLKDKLVELYYNSLLSGPQTHVVNMLSNTLTALGQLPEHAVAAGIGGARKALLRGAANPERVLGSELGARVVGMLQGVQEGLGQAARTMRTGHSPDAMTKVEGSEQHAISGLKGKIIRMPTLALTAEDELFKAVARKMETAGLAVRKARGEGLKGPALTKRIAELTANPTDEMIERAFDYGRYITFQKPLGPLGNIASRATQIAPILKLIVPFVRTPNNILKFAIERSPAAPVLKEWRTDMAAGGARRDLAVAKVMLGTGLGALATKWAAQGILTGGGPADDSARRLMEADGWQSYSVKLGNRYYSYQRLDPFSSTLGIAADLVDLRSHMTDKEHENVVSLMTASVLQNLANKTWLSGVSSMVQALNDPGRYADSWLARMAGGVAVPAVVAQTAAAHDPLEREPRTILDRIRSRVPGVRQSIEPRRDVFGRPIASGGGFGPDIVSPIWTSDAKNDPTIAALIDAGARISPPQRTVGGRELNQHEYGRYAELAGSNAKAALDDLVRAPDWDGMSKEDRADAVRQAVADSRRDARDTLGLTPDRP